MLMGLLFAHPTFTFEIRVNTGDGLGELHLGLAGCKVDVEENLSSLVDVSFCLLAFICSCM